MDVGEEQFGFNRGRGTRYAIGLLRMIGEMIYGKRKVTRVFVS